MKHIVLTQGKSAVVDDDDFELVNRFRWYAVNCSGIIYAKTGSSYASTHINGKRKRWQAHMYLHRFLLHPPEGFVVDHKNSNPLDCRRDNMRICKQKHNTYNRRKLTIGQSKYKGIKFHGRDCIWEAHIQIEGRRYYLGRSRNETLAALLYDKGACELFGEYASLNFPRIETKPSVANAHPYLSSMV